MFRLMALAATPQWPRRQALVALGGWVGLTGCTPGPLPTPTYEPGRVEGVRRVLVHPLHNPVKLFEVYEPWVDDLGQQVGGGQPWKLEASANYASFEAKLGLGAFALALPNPLQTLAAIDAGHSVLGTAGADDDFRGLILVRRDSPLATLADLRGRMVAYPAPTALAATLLPQWMMWQAGVHPLRDARAHYVVSQESALINLAQGLADAAATWPIPWRAFQREQPALAASLRVLAASEPLVNNSIVAHRSLPMDLVQGVRAHLVHLHRRPEGAALLARMGMPRFFPATAATYEPVRRFIRAFEANVRLVADGHA